MKALAASLILLAACGGGTAEGGGGPTATDATGQPIRGAGGEAVSAEAHEHWSAALALFQRYEQQGWSGHCDEAVDAFEEANDAQGGRFAEALYMMGVAASRCNDMERARQMYTRALEANGRLCKARTALGVMDLEAGRQPAAQAAFQRALTEDSRCTEAYVNLAIIQRQQGSPDSAREALNNLRRALAIDAGYLVAFNEMALLYLGQAQSNAQMLDLAGVVCRQAQQIDANYAPIYNTWGLVNVRKGNIIEALRLFERAYTLDNAMFEAHMNFGQITLSFRGYEDARTAFARAAELRPRDYDAHIGLGAALRGLAAIVADPVERERKMRAEVQPQYELATQIDANRPESYFNLGVLYQDYMSGSIEDMQRARGYFEQFVAKAGRNAQFAQTVEDVTRRCQDAQARPTGRRRRRPTSACRPGRLQNIQTAVETLQAAAQVTQQAAQQQQNP